MKNILLSLALILCLSNTTTFAKTLTSDLSKPNRESLPKDEVTYELRAKVIIESINRKLEDYVPTGNTNIDYLGQLVELHSEELLLSLAIQNFTDNPLIINNANDIIADESGQLKEMRILRKQLLDNYTIGSESNSDYISEYIKISKEMLDKFSNYKPTGDDITDYLNYILIGNDASIKISNAAIPYMTNDTAKKIAENVIRLKTEQNTKIISLIKEVADLLKKAR